MTREWPSLRFAFSRPGFLTFKLTSTKKLPDDFGSKLVVARAAGVCLGKASGPTPAERADSVWKLIGDRKVTQLHVWPRDRHPSGFRDYEPGMTPEAAELERVIRERAPEAISRQLPTASMHACLVGAASESLQTSSPAPPCPPLRRVGDHT